MPLRGGMEIDSFMQNPSDGPSRRKKEKEKGRKRQMRRWALTVLLASFLITALLSLASGEIIEGLPMFASILVLVLFVALGIVFDIILYILLIFTCTAALSNMDAFGLSLSILGISIRWPPAG